MAKFRNYYHCAKCGTVWHDDSDHTNNDRCPKCDTEIKPYESEDIMAKKNKPNLTGMLSVNEVQDKFTTLLDSCVEGYDGTWDPTGEGRDGFEAMYRGLQKLALHFKVDTSEAKDI